MAAPDAWKEFCLIGIIPEDYPSGAGGGNEIAFAGITDEISAMDWGERDIEGVPLVNGGRIVKTSPMGDETLTRSEEHTSELQSHSFISYAVFCLKKKNLLLLLFFFY